MEWLLLKMMGVRSVLQSPLDRGLSLKTSFFSLNLPSHPPACIPGYLGFSHLSASPGGCCTPNPSLKTLPASWSLESTPPPRTGVHQTPTWAP